MKKSLKKSKAVMAKKAAKAKAAKPSNPSTISLVLREWETIGNRLKASGEVPGFCGWAFTDNAPKPYACLENDILLLSSVEVEKSLIKKIRDDYREVVDEHITELNPFAAGAHKLTDEAKELIELEYRSQVEGQYGDNDLSERKKRGQFFTPPPITYLLLENFDLALVPCSSCLDPSTGSGGLAAGLVYAGANPRLICAIELDPEIHKLAQARLGKLGVLPKHIKCGNALEKESYVFEVTPEDYVEQWKIAILYRRKVQALIEKYATEEDHARAVERRKNCEKK